MTQSRLVAVSQQLVSCTSNLQLMLNPPDQLHWQADGRFKMAIQLAGMEQLLSWITA